MHLDLKSYENIEQISDMKNSGEMEISREIGDICNITQDINKKEHMLRRAIARFAINF